MRLLERLVVVLSCFFAELETSWVCVKLIVEEGHLLSQPESTADWPDAPVVHIACQRRRISSIEARSNAEASGCRHGGGQQEPWDLLRPVGRGLEGQT